MVIGTALGWGNVATIVLAVALVFLFGYSLTMLPLLSSGMALAILPLASACDALPITVMEIVDNLIMLVVPGAMGADLASPLLLGPSRSPSPPPSRQPLPHSPRKGPRRCRPAPPTLGRQPSARTLRGHGRFCVRECRTCEKGAFALPNARAHRVS
jgi:hypothetical protein